MKSPKVKIAIFLIFIVIFSSWKLSFKNLAIGFYNTSEAEEAEVPAYVKAYFKEIYECYKRNGIVFSVQSGHLIVVFGEFENSDEKDAKENYKRVMTRPVAIIIFDGILENETDFLSILEGRMQAFKFGYYENIKQVFLYGDEVSVSWTRKINELKAEIKCTCGCAIGVFSRDICTHKNCPMKKQ